MKMFELPQGEPIEGEMDLGVDINVFSFDFGASEIYLLLAKDMQLRMFIRYLPFNMW